MSYPKIQLQIWLCLILAFRTCLGWFCAKRCGYANNDFRSVLTDDEVHGGRKAMNGWNFSVIATLKGNSYSAALYVVPRVTENEKQLSKHKVHALLTKCEVNILLDISQKKKKANIPSWPHASSIKDLTYGQKKLWHLRTSWAIGRGQYIGSFSFSMYCWHL